MNHSKINFSHVMNPAQVNAIRDFCDKTTSILTFDQLLSTNSYIQMLLSTTETFAKDNELLEKISQKKDTAKNLGMKESDVELYSQLMKMYKDYLMKLCNLKREGNFLNKDLIKYDYLNSSIFPKILLNCDPNDVRTEYVQQLIEITKNTELATKFFSKKKAKSSLMDENVPTKTTSSIKSTAGTLTKKPKKEITTVKVSLKRSNPTTTEEKADKVELKKRKKIKTETDETVKRRGIPVAIRTSSISTNPESESSATKSKKSPSPSLKTPPQESFALVKTKSQESSILPSSSSSSSSTSFSASPSILQPSSSNNSSNLKSILKKTEDNQDQTTTFESTKNEKSQKQLSFNTDSVTVFGHDLPKHGVKVAFKELKQALNNEKKASTPKEKLLVDPSRINVLTLAPFSDINCISQCDISELKGGVVKLQTNSKPEYRSNFRNFNKNLNKEHTEKEFHSQTEEVKEESDSINQPIVMPAFGQNQLLLLKDRGKLPYKQVPEVRPNAYPPVSKL